MRNLKNQLKHYLDCRDKARKLVTESRELSPVIYRTYRLNSDTTDLNQDELTALNSICAELQKQE